MRYLIHTPRATFYTDWFTLENNWHDEMIVFDLFKSKFCVDGKNWVEIEEDHL
jgi:hypothetical protein